jgi:molybdopterin-guanine dinucleotide biosynthesis protein A
MNPRAQLHGLVLAGGRSTRMQRDKAVLEYRPGETQLDAAMQMLAGRVARAFVSVRAEQRAEPVRARYPQIVDREGLAGPIAGIAAAFTAHPDAAWLVLACDLPHLDARTLDHLIERRSGAVAVAYRSSHDSLPEPLCALYEPAARVLLEAHIAAGRHCPRKFLIDTAGVELLDQPNGRALDNVNTVDEYGRAMSDLNDSAAEARPIRVQYYALLREQAGRSDETLETAARTPRELYDELRARHPFTLGAEVLRVAVNGDFGDWSQPLAAGDSVVFIPPVAGG